MLLLPICPAAWRHDAGDWDGNNQLINPGRVQPRVLEGANH